MSENLDLVRSIYADWERGDYSSAEWADPEIEYVLADGPAPGTLDGAGRDGTGLARHSEVWQEFRAEPEECRELDDERVLVLDHSSGRGKTSGLEIGQTRTQGATLLHVRDGKVTRLVLYWDRDRALADLGLKE